MGKDKLKRFKENLTFRCLIQPLFEEVFRTDYKLKGNWGRDFFGNDNPIVLELGCGRGEYTVGLANMYPEMNFIGIDVKGARLWRGAKTATEENIPNVAFIRTRIEFIDSFFAENEVSEIWITFPDPQLYKTRIKKRLTGALFLKQYASFLSDKGCINLKTDSEHLHLYTKELIKENELEQLISNMDVYNAPEGEVPAAVTALQTTYEAKYLAEGKPITFLQFKLKKDFDYVNPFFEADELLPR